MEPSCPQGEYRPLFSYQDHPTQIELGMGCLDKLGPHLMEHGIQHVAIIYGVSPKRHGHLDRIQDHLQAHDIQVDLYSGVPEEPYSDDVDRFRAELRLNPPQALIGLGGGSVMDLAKFVAYLTVYPHSCRDFDGGGMTIEAEGLPMLMIPTTAGTGSEVTPYSVINNRVTGKKFTVTSPYFYPKWAFIDPSLTATLPQPYRLATGLDTLIHCMEAYLSKKPHPKADDPALEGFQLVRKHLPRAMNDPTDEEALTAMAKAAMLGGIAISHSRTGLIHTLSVALAKHCDHPHGMLNAIIAGYVFEFNLEGYDEERLHLLFETSGTRNVPFVDFAADLVELGVPEFVEVPRIDLQLIMSLIKRVRMDGGLEAVNPMPISNEDLDMLFKAILKEV